MPKKISIFLNIESLVILVLLKTWIMKKGKNVNALFKFYANIAQNNNLNKVQTVANNWNFESDIFIL